MLKVLNATIGYGHKVIIGDISFEIRSGKLVALLGRNGTGKSTLLRAIATGVAIKGEIEVAGKDVKSLGNEEIARLTSYVGTERVRIPNMRCFDLVALGRAPYTNWIGSLSDEDKVIVSKALESVGMSDYAERTMDKMSDGECQRIMIARALAQDTPLILLDEPTAFLDIPGKYQVMSILSSLTHGATAKTIIVSTHDMDAALEFADEVLLLKDGQISLFQVAGNKERITDAIIQ